MLSFFADCTSESVDAHATAIIFPQRQFFLASHRVRLWRGRSSSIMVRASCLGPCMLWGLSLYSAVCVSRLHRPALLQIGPCRLIGSARLRDASRQAKSLFLQRLLGRVFGLECSRKKSSIRTPRRTFSVRRTHAVGQPRRFPHVALSFSGAHR